MNGFKGQSAIEYLMTYGWMLLVVAVAGGAVYSFAGPQCVETTDFSSGGAFVDDFGVDSNNGNLTLVVGNSGGNIVDVTGVQISTGEMEEPEDLEVSPADTETFTSSQQFTSSDECNNFDIMFEYDQGSLTSLQSSGTISAGIEAASAPSSPEIEDVNQ